MQSKMPTKKLPIKLTIHSRQPAMTLMTAMTAYAMHAKMPAMQEKMIPIVVYVGVIDVSFLVFVKS